MKKLRSYHFDFGNSSRGPVGYCARVTARSKREAVRILKTSIAEEVAIGPVSHADDIQYIRAYFNPWAISTKDIDEVNEL